MTLSSYLAEISNTYTRNSSTFQVPPGCHISTSLKDLSLLKVVISDHDGVSNCKIIFQEPKQNLPVTGIRQISPIVKGKFFYNFPAWMFIDPLIYDEGPTMRALKCSEKDMNRLDEYISWVREDGLIQFMKVLVLKKLGEDSDYEQALKVEADKLSCLLQHVNRGEGNTFVFFIVIVGENMVWTNTNMSEHTASVLSQRYTALQLMDADVNLTMMSHYWNALEDADRGRIYMRVECEDLGKDFIMVTQKFFYLARTDKDHTRVVIISDILTDAWAKRRKAHVWAIIFNIREIMEEQSPGFMCAWMKMYDIPSLRSFIRRYLIQSLTVMVEEDIPPSRENSATNELSLFLDMSTLQLNSGTMLTDYGTVELHSYHQPTNAWLNEYSIGLRDLRDAVDVRTVCEEGQEQSLVPVVIMIETYSRHPIFDGLANYLATHDEPRILLKVIAEGGPVSFLTDKHSILVAEFLRDPIEIESAIE